MELMEECSIVSVLCVVTLETSALEYLYGGQITLSAEVKKPRLNLTKEFLCIYYSLNVYLHRRFNIVIP